MANKKYTELTAAAALAIADVLAVVQDISTVLTSRKTTLGDLRKFFQKEVVTALTSGTTVTADCSLGKNFTLTLGHNVGTFTLSNLNGSGIATEIEVEIKQPASGGPYTFAMPAAFKALGGSDTGIASAANAVTLLSAKTFDNGTTWRYTMQESA